MRRHTPLFALLLLTGASQAHAFELHSPSYQPDATVPAPQVKDGCGGSNVSPAVSWSDPPEGTRSYALTLFDPDARGGAGWWHWLVVDLPADAHALPEGAGGPAGAGLPAPARQLPTSFGTAAYGGPCPPPGAPAHHYELTLYALKTARLALPDDATPAAAAGAIRAAAIGSVRVTARYGR